MFIIDLTYKEPLSEVEKYLEEHKKFLKIGYKDRHFFASGRKNPRTGGIIFATFLDLATCKTFIKQDPFYQNNIAHYQFVEFKPSMFNKDIIIMVALPRY
ncbi:MAG: GTP cyclohydrolase [Gammaproteobacteria bacterium]|nr:GTP cyclohydrolase [Gammaproteobacteria bacterium]